MMISTKGRYALRIMVDLAVHDGEEPVSVREIAQRQDISGKYMEQIISVLTRAGLLRSVRGAQGGYHLAHTPEEITVGMILRATEGDLAPAECVVEGALHCDRSGKCPSRTVFAKVYQAINSVIDGVTLRELMPEGERDEYICSMQAMS
ncbi:MAG: Rrf2 family transcriptional regulator [Clostridia bacterium]|nr:Rrf2 family transcriptional regulator [Clostridia bacterium]